MAVKVFQATSNHDTSDMFTKEGFKMVNYLDESVDLVVFNGGGDISPSLYGEKPLKGTYAAPLRDKAELDIYHRALDMKIPMAGICRGAQLLNVMNGGKLWQDVNNHGNGIHAILDIKTDRQIHVMTLHHQMMIINKDEGELVAYASVATELKKADATVYQKTGTQKDPEVVWYPKNKHLCFQSHPEFREGTTRNYFFELLNRYIFVNNGKES